MSTAATSTLRGPLTEGQLTAPASPVGADLAAAGYIEEEFVASGAASCYVPEGILAGHGRWTVRVDGEAPYATRIIVRRPADPARFNGTVLVEWFNVSGGLEAAPDWSYLSTEIVRSGYGYVGVSAQALGVAGGHALVGLPDAAPSSGLRAAQPARYGSLTHPGDRFSFDMFSQIGRALRDGIRAMTGGTAPRRLLAVGESQSAFFLTSYIDAVHPTARVYDGFFVHSRGGSAASPSGEPIGSSIVPKGVEIRDDLDVPVLVFETETDLGSMLDYGRARQPDTDRFRLWEVAGTAHADAYLVGGFARILGCETPINEGPQHFVLVAALDALNRWVTEGKPPPRAPPLAMQSTDPPRIARDPLGNAVGGVRTPAVDVPVAALSGEAAPGATTLCQLFGSTTPFDQATLARLYGDKQGYLAAFERSLDETVRAGYLLGTDRPELLEQARRVEFPASSGS